MFRLWTLRRIFLSAQVDHWKRSSFEKKKSILSGSSRLFEKQKSKRNEMWRKWDEWNAKVLGFCHVHAGVTCDLSIRSFSIEISIMQLIWFESGDAILFYATWWRSFVYVRFSFDIWSDTGMWRKGNISGTYNKVKRKFVRINVARYF